MKKNDWILVLGICFLAGVFWMIAVCGSAGGDNVSVWVDGELYGTYRLDETKKIDINGTNLLVIEEGRAYMESADCRDQICVHQKAIRKNGESIICLPNKVVAEVHAREESNLDGVAQ